MRASNPDKIAFYEGLIRVLDETGRVIPAGDFMALAEEANLGREIDVAALHLGLEALRDNPGLRLSINMSARSIGYSKWSNLLRRYLALDRSIGERLIIQFGAIFCDQTFGFFARFHQSCFDDQLYNRNSSAQIFCG